MLSDQGGFAMKWRWQTLGKSGLMSSLMFDVKYEDADGKIKAFDRMVCM
jgi:hypothetical protein